MPTLLRISLIAVSLALGIAMALALALNKPAAAKSKLAQLPAAQLSARKSPAALLKGHEMPPPPATPAPTLPSIAPPATPVVAPYRDSVAAQFNDLHETIAQLDQAARRRQDSMMRAFVSLQERIEQQEQPPAAPQPAPPAPAQLPAPLEPPAAPGAAPPPAAEAAPDPLGPESIRRLEGDEGLHIEAQNSDIRAVLEALSKQAGLNIMAGRGVTGTVTANLNGVSVETALAAILKTTGYVARREGNIVYVGTPAELAQMDQIQDQIITRIYRPNYARASELQALFTSLLTPGIGKITVSSPAEIDIPADQNKVGGNGFAGMDVVIVRDYAAVIAQIDQIFEEVDIKPKQVAIEAMILSVSLSDTYKFGVNFEALRDNANLRLISGTPPASLAAITPGDGGLKFGFMDANLTLFIEALETIGDTNVVASPRLTCLNKQRAEIQIGEELGYVSTTVTESAATQTVNFLDVGTLLRIRPYIGNDGLIRLEVHPELSTGSVEVQQGLSLPQKQVTQVTTNVLCPDGCTVVIGGLIREDLTTVTKQIPLLGSLPWVGPVFRQKDETIDRDEIIVLITPRIVSEPFMCQEGQKMGNDYTQRQKVYFDKMSPLGRRHIAEHHLRMTRAAYSAGDYLTAMKQANLAIHYDPQNVEGLTLRNEIIAAGGFEDETIHQYLHRGLAPLTGRLRDYSRQRYPWKTEPEFGAVDITATDDPGQPGPTRLIVMPPPPPLAPVLSAPALPTPRREVLPQPERAER